LSELSEGEKEKTNGSNNHGASFDNPSNSVYQKLNSETRIVSDEEEEEGKREHLYIVLIR
jgi:hypothetical protein